MFTWPFTALSFPICCPSLLFRKWQARKQSKLREGENQHINRMIQPCSSRYLNVRMLLELEYLWVLGCSDRTTHLKSLTIPPKDALPHRIPLNFHQLSSPPHLLLICPAYFPSLHSSLPPSLPLRLSLPSHKITGHLQTIPLILQLQSSVPTSFTFSLSQTRLSIIYAYILLIWKLFDMLEKNNCHAGSKFF